jgi:DNA replication protein DnaC
MYGYTIALHIAAMLRDIDCLQALLPMSPWNYQNKNGNTFLDILSTTTDISSLVSNYISHVIDETLTNSTSAPETLWVAYKYKYKYESHIMDDLMHLHGLVSMKQEALTLYSNVQLDQSRDAQSQVTKKKLLNFAFVGSPGVGKKYLLYTIV